MSREERIGQRFILASMLVEGLFPTIVHAGALAFPPVWFAGVSALLSAIIHLGIVVFRGRWNFSWKLFWPWIGLTLFVPVIPVIFIVLGTRLSTGINTALLLQTELLAAFIILGLFFGERMRPLQSLGALFVLLGTVCILFQGSFELNIGDVLIVFGVSFFPWGNMCAKKLLRHIDPFQVMFLRSSLGGVLLLLISLLVEGSPLAPLSSQGPFWIIIAYALIILVGSKLLWYAGFQHVQILKATSLIVAFPIVGVIVAALYFREIPTVFQIAGFFTTVCGLILLTRQTKNAL